ncbi:hypothetical protein F5X68DRAFT_236413 [Plectosphaerella plurivora]|uniref:Biotin-protein ligase N-terminal domain-containing protein n=1 Tax=Plectosphaerella plurivora TaxID=936078 RepID=A0A9P8V3X0_9PEZI|nr:hypothetical protein F5X68DRAFT_236413 [Plectosphaerella plurivora]
MSASTSSFISLRNILLATVAILSSTVMSAENTRPQALVYRGPTSCDGCPESVGDLLTSSPWHFQVTYVGPGEKVKVTKETLSKVRVFAHGGGPDVAEAWNAVKGFATPLKTFISSGGIYMGFCLGAYLAGNSDDYPGFDILPHGVSVDSEIKQKDAEITNDEDTVIQLDWKFQTGKVEENLWAYFQEGAVMKGLNGYFNNGGQGRIIANYSMNDNVAASVTPYGKGWVGIVGPHPEADKSWYTMKHISNPDGYSFDMGFDFINATLNAGMPLP